MLATMTNDHSNSNTTAEPGEHAATGEQAAAEFIPAIASDWAPEVDDYQISTA
jgi:hypothetical protein